MTHLWSQLTGLRCLQCRTPTSILYHVSLQWTRYDKPYHNIESRLSLFCSTDYWM